MFFCRYKDRGIRPSRAARFCMLGSVAILCGIAFQGRIELEIGQRAADRDWLAKRQLIIKGVDQIFLRLKQLNADRSPLNVMEQELNRGQPLQTAKNAGKLTAIIKEPIGGNNVVEVEFDDKDRPIGYHSLWTGLSAVDPVALQSAKPRDLAGLCLWFSGVALQMPPWSVLWIVAIMIWAADSFHRRLWAESTLALAMACAASVLLQAQSVFSDRPGHAAVPPPQGEGMMLAISVAMLAVSSLLVAIPIWRSRARTASGFVCTRCSYNLTGNVSGVCPECGTEIPKPAGEISHSG